MDDGAIKIARYGEFDHIERLIAPDEDDASHHGRSCVVGVIAAAGEVFSLHRALHHLLFRERAAEKFVHSVGGGSTGCGAASYTRTRVDLLADAHADFRLVTRDFQELAYYRSDDVLLYVFRKGNRGVVYD